MIIHRFAVALRRQDWITVTIELLIVIAGILFALRVDDWNAERLARQQDYALLEELHQEMISSIDIQLFFINRIDGWVVRAGKLIDAIERQDLSSMPDEEIVAAIRTVNFFPVLMFPRRVLDVYNRQGGLISLKAPEVELAVAKYSEEFTFAKEILDVDRARSPSALKAAGTVIKPSLNAKETFGVAFQVDRESLLANPELINVMYEAYYLQSLAVKNHRTDLLERAMTACAALANYLNQPACPVSRAIPDYVERPAS